MEESTQSGEFTLNKFLEAIQHKNTSAVLEWCYENRNNIPLETLKSYLGCVTDSKVKIGSDFYAERDAWNYINLTLDNGGGNPIYIDDPNENRPDDVTKIEAEEGKSLTKEQEKKNENIDKYLKRQEKQTFYAQLMRDMVAREIKERLHFLRRDNTKNKEQDENPDTLTLFSVFKKFIPLSTQEELIISRVNNFRRFNDDLRDGDKTSIDPDKAEERYLFKAEARLLNVLLKPNDQKASDEFNKLGKKMSGQTNWKYIAIGIAMLLIAAAIIGVSCGVAAGAIVICGIVAASFGGVSMVAGGIFSALFTGYQSVGSKSSKFSLRKGAPVVNRDVCWKMHAIWYRTKPSTKPTVLDSRSSAASPSGRSDTVGRRRFLRPPDSNIE